MHTHTYTVHPETHAGYKRITLTLNGIKRRQQHNEETHLRTSLVLETRQFMGFPPFDFVGHCLTEETQERVLRQEQGEGGRQVQRLEWKEEEGEARSDGGKRLCLGFVVLFSILTQLDGTCQRIDFFRFSIRIMMMMKALAVLAVLCVASTTASDLTPSLQSLVFMNEGTVKAEDTYM